jgi:tetratricopeptide (TPR) repeat protein
MGIVNFLTKVVKTEQDLPKESVLEVAQRLQTIFPEINWYLVGTVREDASGQITDPREHRGWCGIRFHEKNGTERLLFYRTICSWPPPENEQLVEAFLDTTANFLSQKIGAAVLVRKDFPAPVVTFNTSVIKGLVGYTDEKLRTLVELNYRLGDAVREITISVCRREMQPSEAASEVATSLAAIMASRSWMIGDTPIGSKRIPDSTKIIGVGNTFLVDSELWKWVNTAAHRNFDDAQQCRRHGDVTEAVSKYMAAIESEPRWCAPYYELGSLFFSRNDLSRATSLLRKSIEVEPIWAPAYFNLSACYKAAGEFQTALGLLLKYVELAPTDPEGFYAIGCIYMHTGDVQRENQAYEAALRLNSDYIPAHLNLARDQSQDGGTARERPISLKESP